MLRLALGGCLAVLAIISIVLMLQTPSYTGNVLYPVKIAESFSNRYCPPGYYSAMRQSLPVYSGGPAEQFNIVCIKEGEVVYAENLPFERKHVPLFDRFRQDRYVMLYG